jgi:hypothetical protein
MIKFNKDYNLKIMSLLIAVMFLLNNTVYGIQLSNNKIHLRVPVGKKSTYDRMCKEIKKSVLEKYLTPQEAERFKKIVDELNLAATRLDLVKGRVFEFSFNPVPEEGGDSGDHVSVNVNLGSIRKSKNVLAFTIAHELAHLLLLHQSFSSHFYQRYYPSVEDYFRERELAADKLAMMILMTLPDYSVEGIIKNYEEYLQIHPDKYFSSFTHPSIPMRIAVFRDLAVLLEGLSTDSILRKTEEFINDNAFINIEVGFLSVKEHPSFMSRSQVISILIKKELRPVFASIRYIMKNVNSFSATRVCQ